MSDIKKILLKEIVSLSKKIVVYIYFYSQIPGEVSDEDAVDHVTTQGSYNNYESTSSFGGSSGSTKPMNASKKAKIHASENLLQVFGGRLSSSRTEDDHDIFAKHLACKLRKMSEPMAVLAEKLMSDIAYAGISGTLKATTTIVTPPPAGDATSQVFVPQPAFSQMFHVDTDVKLEVEDN